MWSEQVVLVGIWLVKVVGMVSICGWYMSMVSTVVGEESDVSDLYAD